MASSAEEISRPKTLEGLGHVLHLIGPPPVPDEAREGTRLDGSLASRNRALMAQVARLAEQYARDVAGLHERVAFLRGECATRGDRIRGLEREAYEARTDVLEKAVLVDLLREEVAELKRDLAILREEAREVRRVESARRQLMEEACALPFYRVAARRALLDRARALDT